MIRALFLGHFAATVAPRILAKVKTPLETSILDDEGDAAQLAALLADAEIVVYARLKPLPGKHVAGLHESENVDRASSAGY